MKDLPHFGAFFKYLRTKRDVKGTDQPLKQVEIEKHCNVDDTQISHFEAGRRKLDEETFDCVIELLKAKVGLSDEAIRKLKILRLDSDPTDVKRAEEALALVSFESLMTQHELLESLKGEKRPTYVQDPLWFVHVFNAPMIRLFDMRPDYLRRWEAWHVLATKYYPDSPVRAAHPKVHRYKYFEPACQRFFEGNSRYMFTSQMRRLLLRLWDMSDEFENLWENIVTLRQDYPTKHIDRRITYGAGKAKKKLRTKLLDRDFPVTVIGGTTVTFTQVIWDPENSHTDAVFEEIAQSCAIPTKDGYRCNLAFAADYVQDY